MLELVLVACLLKDPGHCEAHRLPLEPMGVVECMVTSQQHMVRWVSDHPGWLVRRWRCDFPRA